MIGMRFERIEGSAVTRAYSIVDGVALPRPMEVPAIWAVLSFEDGSETGFAMTREQASRMACGLAGALADG